MSVPAGTRLRCDHCGAEAIVVKDGGAELACCAQPMTVTFTPERPAGS